MFRNIQNSSSRWLFEQTQVEQRQVALNTKQCACFQLQTFKSFVEEYSGISDSRSHQDATNKSLVKQCGRTRQSNVKKKYLIRQMISISFSSSHCLHQQIRLNYVSVLLWKLKLTWLAIKHYIVASQLVSKWFKHKELVDLRVQGKKYRNYVENQSILFKNNFLIALVVRT